MEIFSADFAEHMVKEMDKIIPFNINMMNGDGVIIASKDLNRIGSFHEGALRAIQEQKTILIYPEETLRGAKEGINMPIIFEGSVRGIIGITGHPKKVESYGNIILKMTELMINEAFAKHELQLETQAKEWFIYEWLLEHYSDEQSLVRRGETLGVDVNHPRMALVFMLKDISDNTDLDRQKWIETTIMWFRGQEGFHNQDIFLSWKTNQLILLLSMENEDEDKLSQKVFKKVIKRSSGTNVTLTCGIGGKNSGIRGMVQSFQEANHALQYTNNEKPLIYYNKLGVESLLIHLSEENKQNFIKRFFPFMYKKENQSLIHTLNVFYQYDQSIEKTKEALFIHKNTLQYRLKKIENLTGYDPRNFRHGLLFFLALQMLDSNNGI